MLLLLVCRALSVNGFRLGEGGDIKSKHS